MIRLVGAGPSSYGISLIVCCAYFRSIQILDDWNWLNVHEGKQLTDANRSSQVWNTRDDSKWKWYIQVNILEQTD